MPLHWGTTLDKANNIEAERKCCDIRLRADREAGELLSQMEKAKSARSNPRGRGAPVVPSSDARTLSDLGSSSRDLSVSHKRWFENTRR